MLYNIVMKKIFAGAIAAVGALSVLAFGGCNAPNTGGKTYFYMNTPATLYVKNMDAQQFGALANSNVGFDDLADKVDQLLYSTENSISGTVTSSSVYKFNAAAAGTDVEIDKTCYDVLTVAKAVYEQTEGAYNPAVWYCEDLYGFAPRALSDPAMLYDRASTQILPDQKYIDAFKSLASHFGEVTLREDGGKFYAYKPQETVTVEGDNNEYALRLDLGGIGKGWVADKISALMDSYGAKYGYFDFGNSSMAVKSYYNEKSGEGEEYTLSARDPRSKNSPFVSFQIKYERLSTS
ncbi:MAG: FAD:protein FMN transferase, partial [Clostridia bacterium]|nr:FAD:protein FMN transferase [Clostridia bacterium]